METLLGTKKGEQVFEALLELSGIEGQLRGYLESAKDVEMIPETLKEVQRRIDGVKHTLEDAYFGDRG